MSSNKDLLEKPDLKPAATELNDIKKISSEWGVDVNHMCKALVQAIRNQEEATGVNTREVYEVRNTICLDIPSGMQIPCNYMLRNYGTHLYNIAINTDLSPKDACSRLDWNKPAPASDNSAPEFVRKDMTKQPST